MRWKKAAELVESIYDEGMSNGMDDYEDENSNDWYKDRCDEIRKLFELTRVLPQDVEDK